MFRGGVLAAACCLWAAVGASPAEEKLLRQLFENYDSSTLPVATPRDAVRVNLSYVPIKLGSLDVDEGEMSIHGWLKLAWTDRQLTWNASEHDGISVLHVSPENIWRPDLKVYNGPESNVDNTLTLVYSTGQVLWVPPLTAQVTCDLNATWFPFDVQRCLIKFGSWTYDGTKIDLQIYESTGDDDMPAMASTEWRLIKTDIVRSVKKYACCAEPYPSIDVWLTLKRRACRHVVQQVLPVVALTLLGLATMLVPAVRADVRLLVVTLLLGSAVVQLRLGDFEIPERLSAMTLLHGQLFAVLVGLFVCNCVHLAVLRGHMDCSLIAKLSGLVSSAAANGGAGGGGDKSEGPLLSDALEDRYHRTLDSVFALPLSFLALVSVALFFSIPLF